MARETIDRREKLLKLREELLAAEEDFLQGRFYTVDEVAEKMRQAIKQTAPSSPKDQ